MSLKKKKMALTKNNQRTTQNQFEIMLRFLEKNHAVLYPSDNTITSKKKYNIAWEVLTDVLNSDASGPSKSVDRWKKTLRDWKQYVKMKADRVLNSENGYSSKEILNPLEERLAVLLGHNFEDIHDYKCKSGSDSSKRKLENEEECDSPDSQYGPEKDDVEKIDFEEYLRKRLKKETREESETFIEENEDRLMQARLVEAEEQKADALQRLATSFESIAASVELLCHSLTQK